MNEVGLMTRELFRVKHCWILDPEASDWPPRPAFYGPPISAEKIIN